MASRIKCLSLLLLLLTSSLILPEGFYSGTLVKVKDKYVPINDIKVEDKVLAYNFKSKQIEESKVTQITNKHYSTCTALIVNRTVIITAPDHKFYCPMNKNRWTLAKDLKAGDYILRDVKDLVKIEWANEVPHKADFYCLSIENNHNYFVSTSDILVHNAVAILVAAAGAGIAAVVDAVFKVGVVGAGIAGVLIAEGFFGSKYPLPDTYDGWKDNWRQEALLLTNDNIENKKHHLVEGKQGKKHGFLTGNGGPDDDPEYWWQKILRAVSEAAGNHPEGTRFKIIRTHSAHRPGFGDLIIEVMVVSGVLRLSTAYLENLSRIGK